MLSMQKTGTEVIEPWNIREYATFRVFADKEDQRVSSALQELVDAGCLVVRQDPDLGDYKVEDAAEAFAAAAQKARHGVAEAKRQKLLREIGELPVDALEAIIGRKL